MVGEESVGLSVGKILVNATIAWRRWLNLMVTRPAGDIVVCFSLKGGGAQHEHLGSEKAQDAALRPLFS